MGSMAGERRIQGRPCNLILMTKSVHNNSRLHGSYVVGDSRKSSAECLKVQSESKPSTTQRSLALRTSFIWGWQKP